MVLETMVGIVDTAVTVISITVTIISIIHTARENKKHQKSNRSFDE